MMCWCLGDRWQQLWFPVCCISHSLLSWLYHTEGTMSCGDLKSKNCVISHASIAFYCSLTYQSRCGVSIKGRDKLSVNIELKLLATTSIGYLQDNWTATTTPHQFYIVQLKKSISSNEDGPMWVIHRPCCRYPVGGRLLLVPWILWSTLLWWLSSSSECN